MKNRILSILLVFICTAISIIHTSADTEEGFRIDSALDENGLLYVTGFSGSDIPDTVTIPSEINGVKVEGLKNFEILGNGDIKRIPFDLSGIKKLVIEEGAKNISCTFIGSSELEAVVLPESLKNISSDAFREAAKLSDINLENVETVGSFAFYGCSSLKEVKLAAATKVGISAFGNIKDLKMYGNRSSAAEEYAKNNRVLYERLPLETPKGTSLTVDGHTYYGFETYAIKLNKLGLMQGVGQTRTPFVYNIIGMWGVRIVGTFVCVVLGSGGLVAAWGCMIAHNILLFVLFMINFVRGKWNPLRENDVQKKLS